MKKLTLLMVLVLIIQASVLSQPCLPEGITFTTQAQIDNFQTNYPNCTEIEGHVEITGNDITNLNGLNVLIAFGGGLSIGDYYIGNPILTSLTGLDNVTSIGGNLLIRYNDALTSLTGLGNLTSIGGNLEIGNSVLTSLTGLDNLTSIGGCVVITSNAALTSLSGLGNLTSIGGYLFIMDNAVLSSLIGLDNLTSIGGHVEIRFNNALTSLIGLDNVTSVSELLIFGNFALTSLTGLDNLTSIEGYLYIWNNYALTSLTALDNITSIEEDLSIKNNVALTNLSGIDNIDAASIDNLYIFGNISLSTCEVESICNYLASPNGVIEIHDNATGCNNKAEVEVACESGVPNINFESAFSIYPNPAEKEIFICCKNGVKIKEINIYNQIGQKVLHEKRITITIDVSMLMQGMYIIELVSEEFKIREKLMIR
ncbi:MAG: T9SS type A sorting domain-containing protein [Bacteroidetes bacterium]|nr:T9SS type A sorting domain-containing protein [Bacteroidota bacterium]